MGALCYEGQEGGVAGHCGAASGGWKGMMVKVFTIYEHTKNPLTCAKEWLF